MPRLRSQGDSSRSISRACDQPGIGLVRFPVWVTGRRLVPPTEISSCVPQDSDVSFLDPAPG